ncbi:DUF2797 domain-containing protein [Aestuariibacter sp. AA17]|uniref:DUF2797 domain-containing protein n=1 Tax=Fluctibacter corallii TaxID=2984329 RepID=A0ABT3A3Z7_9ALTE|nr:DUF2797 domain-containing protein [Aestuariibacter sp. AA17]MCV2883373.1 DUF2797 domain-containing protein [Aestuariibacter sp. AA17]
MTVFSGNIRKMHVSTDANHQAQYVLPIGDKHIDINSLIDSHVSVTFDSTINCVHCSVKTKKSFNQGYCYRCLTKLAQCDSCIIKPETCHYHEGTCREPEWGETHCLNDHFVYLANTGTLKVGITRHVTDGVSSRWIDQGATQALPILRVGNRRISGLVETACKGFIGDKTNWRTMLKGQPEAADLVQTRDALLRDISPAVTELKSRFGLQSIHEVEASPLTIHYPVLHYPDKIKSINLDKTPHFEGTLTGIKGQYWLLDGDRVINMRKYAGYALTIEIE